MRLTDYVRFLVDKNTNPAVHGLASRKNKFPVGGVMVMLLVPVGNWW
jgi:hypothetical protein